MESSRKKGILKIIGKFLSIVAILFVVKKLLTMNIDYHIFKEPSTLLAVIIVTGIQLLILFCGAYPWNKYIEILSGKKIDLLASIQVFMKANFYKYIPGNVLQFVGRNELAEKKDVGHMDVAMATILETLSTVGFTGIIALVLLRNHAVEYCKSQNFLGKCVIAFGILLVLAVVVLIIAKSGHAKYIKRLSKYAKCFTAHNLKLFCNIVLYYLLGNILTGVYVFALFTLAFHQNLDMNVFLELFGSYLFSYIVGMVTPGASGGIGIREAVMMLMTQGRYDQSLIVTAMLIIRVCSIISDVIGYCLQYIIKGKCLMK